MVTATFRKHEMQMLEFAEFEKVSCKKNDTDEPSQKLLKINAKDMGWSEYWYLPFKMRGRITMESIGMQFEGIDAFLCFGLGFAGNYCLILPFLCSLVVLLDSNLLYQSGNVSMQYLSF